MLMDTVVIVLRETLEAGVLISLLLAMSRSRQWGLSWFWLALAAGLGASVFYALNLGAVSQWFDYVGQELVNAGLQFCLYICLLALLVNIAKPERDQISRVIMALAVVLALTREGTEILVFYSGYFLAAKNILNACVSGFIGLMIGLSVGVLVYYFLLSIPRFYTRLLQGGLLCLVGAGMVAQATQLLIQADIIAATLPLWDSSAYLSEHAILGQMAYAVLGYEATPSKVEVIVYLCALFGIALTALGSHKGNGHA